jgi:hypothetical protein
MKILINDWVATKGELPWNLLTNKTGSCSQVKAVKIIYSYSITGDNNNTKKAL